MNIVGIIAEYNPFHLGHLYHLNMSKQMSKCDYSVVVMSGSFLQRGEPALVDKWTRAKMAVDCGVDLIVELPFAYSCQSAELFASGAVKLLDRMGVVDCVAFGTESADLGVLKSISEILGDEPDSFKSHIKCFLKEGLSFPKARELALKNYIEEQGLPDAEAISEAISAPNNILGIEYLKALRKLDSKIAPLNIPRLISEHNSLEMGTIISSATSIRRTLLKSCDIEAVRHTVPSESFNGLSEFYERHRAFNSLSRVSEYIIYNMISKKRGELADLFDIDQCMENKFKKSLLSASSFDEFLEQMKSKNYTLTRIKRACMNILLELSKRDMEEFKGCIPDYIRVLGSSKKGFEILSEIKKNSDMTIVTKFSKTRDIANPTSLKMIEYDKKATDLYFLGLNSFSRKLELNRDFTTSPYVKL